LDFAVFSDVHGNYEALGGLWKTLIEIGLAERPVLNAGDTVAYGDDPERCIRFIQEHPTILSVRGNYDKTVATYPDKRRKYQKSWGSTRPEKLAAIAVDSGRISASSREWLLDLPRDLALTLGGRRVLVTHYAPGVKEGLGPWTGDARLEELAGQAEADVVVCGHTHVPFIRSAGGVLFVNPGTLGKPWNGEMTYAVLSLDRSPARAELRLL
jgi:putative phosphoesterase